jgi:hypothetical protein
MKRERPKRRNGIHYWAQTYFETLKDIAVEASAFSEWADYAAFCAEYERCLRSQAFAFLERFITSVVRAPFEERRRFVSWLLHTADRRDASTGSFLSLFTFALSSRPFWNGR